MRDGQQQNKSAGISHVVPALLAGCLVGGTPVPCTLNMGMCPPLNT